MKPIIAHIVAFSTLICVSLLGSKSIGSSKSPWYECIKPSITPPSFVFPIVWTLLYLSIAIVLAQVLMSKSPKVSLLVVMAINLILNVSWSYLYFGLKQVRAAFVVTLLLLLTQIAILKMLWGFKRWTFWALVPYAIWLMFACILNGLSIVKESSCVR